MSTTLTLARPAAANAAGQSPAAWFSARADGLSAAERAEALWSASLALLRGEDAALVWRTLEKRGDLAPYPEDPLEFVAEHGALWSRWQVTPPRELAAQCRDESNRLQEAHDLCPTCWRSECETDHTPDHGLAFGSERYAEMREARR